MFIVNTYILYKSKFLLFSENYIYNKQNVKLNANLRDHNNLLSVTFDCRHIVVLTDNYSNDSEIKLLTFVLIASNSRLEARKSDNFRDPPSPLTSSLMV